MIMSAVRSTQCTSTLTALELSAQPQDNEPDSQTPDIVWADMVGSRVEGDDIQTDLTLALVLQGIQMECAEEDDESALSDGANLPQGNTPSDDSSVVINIPTTSEERLTPPDGGFGWFVVAATFLITFLLTGFVKSFGAFKKLVLVEFPETSTEQAAWITGLIGTLPLFLAPVTGILMNAFGFRPMVFVGGLLCTIGLGVSYFLTSAGYLIGSLGVFVGIGSSFVVTSSIVCLGRYFTTMRPTAMALALSGGCLGAVSLPTALKAVLDVLGLRYTFLVVSGSFSMICVCSLAFGPPENRFRREIVEIVATEPTNKLVSTTPKEMSASWSKRFLKSLSTRLAFRFLGDARFLLTVASVFTMTVGNHFLGYTIYQAKQLGVEEYPASLLLAYAAVGDLAIRLTYGVLASQSPFPRTAEFTAALGLSAVSVVAIPFCTELWHLIVIAAASGVTTGMWTILIPLVLSSNHGSENMSSTFTLLKLFQGFAKLLYQPASAALRSAWGPRAVLFFIGAHITLAAIIALILHIVVSVRHRK